MVTKLLVEIPHPRWHVLGRLPLGNENNGKWLLKMNLVLLGVKFVKNYDMVYTRVAQPF